MGLHGVLFGRSTTLLGRSRPSLMSAGGVGGIHSPVSAECDYRCAVLAPMVVAPTNVHLKVGFPRAAIMGERIALRAYRPN